MDGNLGEEPVIVVAEDLSPSETIQMDKSKLLAFVTRLGSSNSHTAILARTMNIPALIGVDIREDWNGKMAIVDGKQGLLFVDPDVANVLDNDGAGIGLFRSEFLYLERDDYPTEEEQFEVYKTVACNMAGKKVVIRTLDIGADKQVDELSVSPAFILPVRKAIREACYK